ncbi:MAG: Yip1 family protein [Anaplasma sp.]
MNYDFNPMTRRTLLENAADLSPKGMLICCVVALALVVLSPILILMLGILTLVFFFWLFYLSCELLWGGARGVPRGTPDALYVVGVLDILGASDAPDELDSDRGSRVFGSPPRYEESEECARAFRMQEELQANGGGERLPNYEESVQNNDEARPLGDVGEVSITENDGIEGEANTAAGDGVRELTQQPEGEPLGQVPSSQMQTDTNEGPRAATARQSTTP